MPSASVAELVADWLTAKRALEAGLADRFQPHPNDKVIRSQPGLGTIIGARVPGEFGDDPNRCGDAKSRKNYAGTSPIVSTAKEPLGLTGCTKPLDRYGPWDL